MAYVADARSTNRADTTYRTTYAYDRLGRTASTTDQRGVVHTYSFDLAGRLSSDTVDSLGSPSADGTVRRIGTAYDSLGRVQAVSSYSFEDSTWTIVNQVEYAYDGWGNLAQEWQEHDGAVDTQSTLSVQYTYDDGASGNVAKYVRLAEVTYPNGREVNYDYGTAGAIDDIMSRLSSIYDDADDDGAIDAGEDVYAAYDYLGANRIVTEDYAEAEVKLDYYGTNNDFAALDRFGRVVDQLWRDYGNSKDADRFLYGYDRVGNRVWKENARAAAESTPIHLDELYAYDNLNQLATVDRGNLNSAHDGIVSATEGLAQDWTLDGLGNWAGFAEDTDGDGTPELSQVRDHNKANELTNIDSSDDDVAHDAAGNMIRVPKLDGSGEHFHLTYDAWNRLAEVYDDDGTTLIATYEYDGKNRRIEKLIEDTPDVNTHFFHKGNQVIETRQATDSSPPESMQPKYQNIWSPRYIDSLILRDENTDTDGQCDDARIFYLADANYNVTAVVAESTPGQN
ncbi:MAG TPA: hypothetical protein VE890_01840, partial [Thermoguttaceae bacterium]|nr:hypothetical protein [Thermoguttaceae bacterium]